MPPRKQPTLTPLELEIMKVLWETGSGNVQAVQERLPEPLAYTTVQTMLNVLHRKGKVKRTLKNRAYIYKPTIGRSDAIKVSVRDLIDRMFGGSAENLVMGLVETRQISPERLKKLQEKLDEVEDAGTD